MLLAIVSQLLLIVFDVPNMPAVTDVLLLLRFLEFHVFPPLL
jgi:hypothetical protein